MRREIAKHCFAPTQDGELCSECISSASPRQSGHIQIVKNLTEQKKTKLSQTKLYQLFSIARSSYYQSLKPKPIDVELIKLQALARQIFNQSKHSAGARTIANVISNQHGIKLTRYKATKLMKSMSLLSKQKKHKYRIKDEKHNTHDNLLNREFSPISPNKVWTGDVTYIRIKDGWCYLAVVIDLYSRNIVGFALSSSADSELTSKALIMAYESRIKPSGVLFHSDQGTHYTSKKFADSVAWCSEMKHSMSRKGTTRAQLLSCVGAKQCFAISLLRDNAPTERFFRSYKTEWMPKFGYADLSEAINDVTDYIWGYYRNVRPHRHNDYLTPVEKEIRFFNKTSY